jgi:hypothetical protein
VSLSYWAMVQSESKWQLTFSFSVIMCCRVVVIVISATPPLLHYSQYSTTPLTAVFSLLYQSIFPSTWVAPGWSIPFDLYFHRVNKVRSRMVFKVQDGIEFATRAEWRNYMMWVHHNVSEIFAYYFINDLFTYSFISQVSTPHTLLSVEYSHTLSSLKYSHTLSSLKYSRTLSSLKYSHTLSLLWLLIQQQKTIQSNVM